MRSLKVKKVSKCPNRDCGNEKQGTYVYKCVECGRGFCHECFDSGWWSFLCPSGHTNPKDPVGEIG